MYYLRNLVLVAKYAYLRKDEFVSLIFFSEQKLTKVKQYIPLIF